MIRRLVYFLLATLMLTHPVFAEPSLQKALAQPYTAPEFTGITTWLNSPPLTMAGLRGKVVLVDFWAYSCINCVRTLPYLNDWAKKYSEQGLVIIGIHAPEFDFEKNTDNINAAIKRYGIIYPVAVDNDQATWDQFHNRYWPAHYLIDKTGNVVYTHIGEGDYDVTENNIRTLLGMNKATTQSSQKPLASDAQTTPETYLGLARASTYSGTPELTDDTIVHYTFADTLPLHHWTLSGKWKIEDERIIAQSSDSALTLHFLGKNVFSVIGPASGSPVQIEVSLQGEKSQIITIDSNRLYTLLTLPNTQEGTLTIKPLSGGVAFYTFTF